MRNAVAYFVKAAEGGEWIESDTYNLGTLKLLLLGTEGVRTATGVDHFPEVTRLVPKIAFAQLNSLTPDLAAAVQWGDNEHPRDLELAKRVTLLGMLAGLTQDDPATGPYVNRLVSDLAAKYKPRGYNTAQPMSRIFYSYNPFADQKDWRGELPKWDFRSGAGMLVARTGWKSEDGLFVAHMPGRTSVDHEVAYFGDFQLYRKGEWALTRPLGYGAIPVGGVAANSLLLGGLSSMHSRGTVAHAAGDGFAYLAGTTSGSFYRPGYYDPPPAFVREWTRSLVYLPGPKGADAVVVYDRVAADNPRDLPKFDRYRAADRATVETAPAVVQWLVHAPERPKEAADGVLEWKTPGGQPLRVTPLSVAKGEWSVIDEKQLWAKSVGEFKQTEPKFQARFSPAKHEKWLTLVNVLTVGDGVKVRRVASANGVAEGVVLRAEGAPDRLVLFGASERSRVHDKGYSVTWEAASERTELHLFDLDPAKPWTLSAGAGPGRPLKVGSGGEAHTALEGKGKNIINLETIK
jgi:hypothetical protein